MCSPLMCMILSGSDTFLKGSDLEFRSILNNINQGNRKSFGCNNNRESELDSRPLYLIYPIKSFKNRYLLKSLGSNSSNRPSRLNIEESSNGK
jgi:hypothetical protein